MKLLEALQIANQPVAADSPRFTLFLACGFTPLHLETQIKAHLRLALPSYDVKLLTGNYGGLLETLQNIPASSADQALAVIEWPDIDPRLGLRHLGGWTPAILDDILGNAEQRLQTVLALLQSLVVPCVIALPTLPLPPASFTTTRQASSFDLRLQQLIVNFAAEVPAIVLNPRELDRLSPLSERHDIASELQTGFPYSRAHSAALASLASPLLIPPTPKKGLITDLDDTLWLGILGEDGVHGISWDLDHHSQMHGAYQQLLRSLAETGVLLAASSKNDPVLVDQAFERTDLLLRRSDLHPIEAHWQPKSLSASRILEKWNIAADSLVFIDDSPMELDEVSAVHPGIQCIRFPKEDPAAIYRLLHQLRDLFGKRRIAEEDRLRAASIRNAPRPGLPIDTKPQLAFSYLKTPPDPRALELINKTNQFNLNGRRYLESEWQTYANSPNAIILLVSYEDKYGPLGKVSALAGRLHANTLTVDTWVLSCRAFSRRIEHRTLQELFHHLQLSQIILNFVATNRNGPFQEFLSSIQPALFSNNPPTVSNISAL